MKSLFLRLFLGLTLVGFSQQALFAQGVLLANGTLTGSSAGQNKDLSGLDYSLENGANADLLGGLGSGLTYVTGDTFLAVPDRGPNAVSYNAAVDDTSSFIARVQTVKMNLVANSGAGLPFILTPQLAATTLLSSPSPLVYGSGLGLGLGSGEPSLNKPSRHYFTGRSDNYDAATNSGDPRDARFDPESIRVSNNGLFVFISDEYGPYIYQFNRFSGQRIRSLRLPQSFFVANPKPTGNEEVSANLTGRTPNKGMEGLAITPDGKTLVGIIQAAFLEDAAVGGATGKLLRIATIDIESGETTHQYAYRLTTGSGVSEITALNDHEFLVDERDGKGLGDGSKAAVKQIFKVDLAGAFDVTGLNGTDAVSHAVSKTLVLDVVKVLKASGFADTQIPAKLEGVTFGPDVTYKGSTLHTLWVANDNDFLQDFSGPNTNPNQYFVFGLTDAELGSAYVPQNVHSPFDK
jgi:Esterase-like activity of phytase